MNKKMWFIFGAAFVLIIGAISFLFLFTYSVSGKVTDITNKQPIKGIKISVASHSQETDEQGTYKITGINIFQKKYLTISAPEQYTKLNNIPLVYSGRQTQKDIALEPTLIEIVNRTLTGGKNGQFDYLWDLMHPDDQAYWESKEKYKSLLSERNTIATKLGTTQKSSTIGTNIRQLETWKSPITNKEYKNVTEVPVEIVMVIDGKEQPQTDLQHFALADGYYRYFTEINKDTTQKAVDAYNQLMNG